MQEMQDKKKERWKRGKYLPWWEKEPWGKPH